MVLELLQKCYLQEEFKSTAYQSYSYLKACKELHSSQYIKVKTTKIMNSTTGRFLGRSQQNSLGNNQNSNNQNSQMQEIPVGYNAFKNANNIFGSHPVNKQTPNSFTNSEQNSHDINFLKAEWQIGSGYCVLQNWPNTA